MPTLSTSNAKSQPTGRNACGGQDGVAAFGGQYTDDPVADTTKALLNIGFTDLDPRAQQAIGRKQSLEQAKSVVRSLRNNGVAALSLGLLYGRPHRTIAGFRQMLDDVVAMQPDRLAIYGYAHGP